MPANAPRLRFEDLLVGDKLGDGGFGVVYKGSYRNKTVAIKFLHPRDRDISQRDKRDFEKEARRLFEALHHPFIIDIEGIVLGEKYALVLEYMHFGHVQHFVKDYEVGLPLKMRITKQIISAMDFLHMKEVKHLDLKAENVLMNSNFDAKVCDFGLSKRKTATCTVELHGESPVRRATISHIAPEVLKNINLEASYEQDVYAFAVTAWEIFTGQIPFGNQNKNMINEAVIGGQRPDIMLLDRDCPQQVKAMIEKCWTQSSKDRPLFYYLKKDFDMLYVPYHARVKKVCYEIRAQICRNYKEDPSHYKEVYECTKDFDTQRTEEETFNQTTPWDSQPDANKSTTRVEHPEENLNPESGTSNEEKSIQEGEPTVQTQLSSSSDSSLATPDGNTERSLWSNVAGPVSQQSGLHCISYGSQNASTNLATPNLSCYGASNDQISNSNVTPAVTPQVNDEIALANYTQRLYVRDLTEGETGQTDMNHHSQDGGNPNIDILVDRITNTQEASRAYVEPQARVDRQIPEAGRGGNQGNPLEATWVGNNPNNQEENDMTMMKMSQMSDRVSVLPPEQLVNRFQSRQGTVFDQNPQPTIHQPLILPSNVNCRQEAQNHEYKTVMPSKYGPSTPYVDAQTGSHAGQAPRQDPQGHGSPFNAHATMNEQSTNARTAQNLQTRETNMAVSSSANQKSPSFQPDNTPVQRNTTNGIVHQAIGSSKGQFLPSYARQQEIFGQRVQNQHVSPPTFLNQPAPFMVSGDYPQHARVTLSQTNMQRPFYPPQQQASINPTYQTAPSQRPMYQPGSSQNQWQPLHILPGDSGTGKLMSDLPEPPSNSTQFRPFSSTENSADQLRTETRPSQTSQPYASRGASQERQATRGTYQDSRTSGKPITINHKHEGGAFTQVFINSEMDLPPNIQIGNKNRMVVYDNREGKQHRKEKVAKRKSKCRLSQLSESRQGLSPAQVDLVSAESGQGWRKVCRQLGLDDPELEQLE
ncbi:probable serine/threonine-protein kinase DDB_G0278665 isoform X2 [Mya arenaria]|nr:probable serine/threonine-protein kinase DDB_G0278665 isoform X2 [Mya arenaria]